MTTKPSQKKPSKTEATPGKQGKSRQGAADPKNLAGFNPAYGELGEPEPAMVYDFTSFAVIALPAELRAALGDDHMVQNALELQQQEMLIIVRERGVVAYVHLPFIVKEIDPQGGNGHSGAVVLKDITKGAAPAAPKEADKAKPRKPAATKKAPRPTTKKPVKP